LRLRPPPRSEAEELAKPGRGCCWSGDNARLLTHKECPQLGVPVHVGVQGVSRKAKKGRELEGTQTPQYKIINPEP
jgi:hypothetical protein